VLLSECLGTCAKPPPTELFSAMTTSKLTFYGTSDASHAIVQEVFNWHQALGVTGYHF
jgi:hypothetical protein